MVNAVEVANTSFGQANAASIKADPNWVQGWGKRPYGWQLATTVQRQITPSLSVAAGYYRSWYGNQVAVNNLAINNIGADFTPYCLPVPSDPKLPASISGSSICGLYDLDKTQLGANGKTIFGQVNNYVTFARNFGHQTDVYNGADILFQIQRRASNHRGWLQYRQHLADSIDRRRSGSGLHLSMLHGLQSTAVNVDHGPGWLIGDAHQVRGKSAVPDAIQS